MKYATVFYLPETMARTSFIAKNIEQFVQAYRDGQYRRAGMLPIGELVGADAAEECFDVTNNPSRGDERHDADWSGKRSVSVGDIIATEDGAWLCMSIGWEKIA